MTVKILNDESKNFIAAAYRERVYDSEELAQRYFVSKRTIQRVLVEMGVNRVRKYRGRKADPTQMPIQMFEPDSQDIQIPETPAPTLSAPLQPPESLMARLWAHIKFCASYPFK
jgi:hypothetical protein